MRPKIRTEHWLFKLWFMKQFIGITLWPYILLRGTRAFDPETYAPTNILLHEWEHFRQQEDYYVIGFYVVYLYHYLVNLIKYKNANQAYRQIPFEIDARKAEWDIDVY